MGLHSIGLSVPEPCQHASLIFPQPQLRKGLTVTSIVTYRHQKASQNFHSSLSGNCVTFGTTHNILRRLSRILSTALLHLKFNIRLA